MNTLIKMQQLTIQKIATSLTLFFYGLFCLFGLTLVFQSSHMQHMHGDCPYTVGEQGICPLSLADTLSNWQQLSTTIFLAKYMPLIAAFSTIIFLLYICASPPLLYLVRHWHKSIEPLYQFLFSNGILNSKAY